MAEAFELVIHVEKLRRNFTASDRREWSNDEVLEWLREAGFQLRGQTWTAEELTLDALAKGEYKIIRRL